MKKNETVNVLKSKKRELFCRLYAEKYWGEPVKAAEEAGYRRAEKSVEELFESEEVLERIRFHRGKLSARSLADDVWIRDSFIRIILNAERDSDKIRALSNLQKALLISEGAKKSEKEVFRQEMVQGLLPLFEGCSDGVSLLPEDPADEPEGKAKE